MHRPGIEPGPPAWQASILPLNQRCIRGKFGEKNCHVHSSVFAEYSHRHARTHTHASTHAHIVRIFVVFGFFPVNVNGPG